MKKTIIIAMIASILLLSPVQGAHFVCGILNPAEDNTDPSWFDVTLYYASDSSKYVNCSANTENLKYCCEATAITGMSWSIGDVMTVEVQEQNEYFAGPVNVTTTGEPYDVAPDMNLTSYLMVIAPQPIEYANGTIPIHVKTLNPFNNSIWYQLGNTGSVLCRDCNEAQASLTGVVEGTHSISVSVNDSANEIKTRAVAFSVQGAGAGGTLYGKYEYMRTFPKITAGRIVFLNPSAGLDVTQVKLQTNRDVLNVRIKLKKYISKPSLIQEPGGGVYSYFGIEHDNVEDQDFDYVEVSFKVPNDWVSKKSSDQGVVLKRYFSNNWQSLKTVEISSDEEYTYYSAESPGLSTFAITIAEMQPAEVPEEETKPVESSIEEPAEEVPTEESAEEIPTEELTQEIPTEEITQVQEPTQEIQPQKEVPIAEVARITEGFRGIIIGFALIVLILLLQELPFIEKVVTYSIQSINI